MFFSSGGMFLCRELQLSGFRARALDMRVLACEGTSPSFRVTGWSPEKVVHVLSYVDSVNDTGILFDVLLPAARFISCAVTNNRVPYCLAHKSGNKRIPSNR